MDDFLLKIHICNLISHIFIVLLCTNCVLSKKKNVRCFMIQQFDVFQIRRYVRYHSLSFFEPNLNLHQ